MTITLHKGVLASFKIESIPGSPASLEDISTWCDDISPSSSQGEYDGTCFQPGVAVPLKRTVPGYADKGYALKGKWDDVVETLFSGIEGQQDIGYEYGPEGTDPGSPKISGLCNCMSYSGPKAPVDGLITWDANLKVTTRVVGVYP